jgi:transposase
MEDLWMSQRHALTDKQWDQIKGLLPGKDGDPGRSAKDNRLFIDALLYVLKTGVPWRDLPERFGNWNSVWRRYDRWCKNGIWKRIVQELSDLDLEELQLDLTSIKVHLAAIGGRREADEKRGGGLSPRRGAFSRRAEYEGSRGGRCRRTLGRDAPQSGTRRRWSARS